MELLGHNTLFTYTNNIIIIGESRYDAEESVKKLIKSSYNMGLVINKNKTKCMVITRNVTAKSNLPIKGLIFEQVGDFKYLGVNINGKNNVHNKIKTRLNTANNATSQ